MNALRLTAVAALSALAIAAQTAHADQSLTRGQVRAELAQAKANGQFSFGELDYPPVAASSSVAASRTQVVAELAQARTAGLISMGELDYPPRFTLRMSASLALRYRPGSPAPKPPAW